MAVLNRRSLDNIRYAHPDMQMIVSEAIKRIGFTVIRCYVGYADQEKAFRTGASPFHFPKSKHNQKPSMAIDFIPDPWNGDWDNLAPFADVAHVFIAVADELYAAGTIKHKFRWGHDWDMDGIEGEKGEWDTDHLELI